MKAYFVNGLLNATPTVIEQGMYDRIKLFDHLQIPAKIVAMAFSTNWGSAVKAEGLAQGDVISAFDLLQGVPKLPIKPLQLADVPDLPNEVSQTEGQKVVYREHSHVAAAVWQDENGGVTRVQRYDDAGQLTSREDYDERGFCSRRKIYLAGKLQHTVYLHPNGDAAAKPAADLTAFTSATLAHLVQPGDLVISERREYDAAIAALPASVIRAYRLYNAPMTITPAEDSLVLTRSFMPAYPNAKIFDEYAADAQLRRGWERILQSLKAAEN